VIFPDVNYELSLEMEMLYKKRELEAIHQLSKKVHTYIGDPYIMVTKYDQLKWLFADFNLGKRISTACIF
jgi:hypothetical protein